MTNNSVIGKRPAERSINLNIGNCGKPSHLFSAAQHRKGPTESGAWYVSPTIAGIIEKIDEAGPFRGISCTMF